MRGRRSWRERSLQLWNLSQDSTVPIAPPAARTIRRAADPTGNAMRDVRARVLGAKRPRQRTQIRPINTRIRTMIRTSPSPPPP